jgi:PAS domain S-box-containing protein
MQTKDFVPRKLLLATSTLTVVFVAVLGFYLWQSYEHQRAILGRALRPIDLSENIILVLVLLAMWVVIVRQIRVYDSDRRTLERTLRKERDLAQMYIEVAGVIFLVLDSDENVVLINQKGCDILGYEKPEIIGKNWFENFVPKDIMDQTRVVFHRLLHWEDGLFGYYEYPILTKTGKLRLIGWNNAVIKNERSLPVATLSSGEDITERKKAEEALRENERRYEIFARETGQLIYDYDVKTGIIRWSGAIEELMGLSQDEAANIDIERWAGLIHPDDRDKAVRQMNECRDKGTRYDFTYRFMQKSGRYIRMEDRGVFLRDKSGVSIRMLGVMKETGGRA